MILRGLGTRALKLFPLFYSYIIYIFCGSLILYLIYWLGAQIYPLAYWLYYLVSILAEFAVLVEISDHIFRAYPAIRNLGRAITLVISIALGLVYVFPAILESAHRGPALFEFALRAAVTKVVILVALFYVARHYGTVLGRNVAGLMFGFSIYLGINTAILAVGKTFEPALGGNVLWVMAPLAYALCALVWTISLWEPAPLLGRSAISTATAGESGPVALELTRFNNQLSKFLHK